MHVSLIFHFLIIYVTCSNSESTNESETSQTTTVKSLLRGNLDHSLQNNIVNPNAIWNHHPNAYLSPIDDASEAQRIGLREPRLLTKLAKTYTFGVDPYFSKGYFEPFEKRPRPVTLIAFRKNVLIPRRTIKMASEQSSEIAELQSPYNHVSNFWIDQSAESES